MKHFFLIIIGILLSTTAHADLRNGLVGWWKMDESSGNVIDSSGQNNTGTPTGTTILSNCKKSGCRSFNGTTDVVNIGSASAINSLVNNFFAAVWIYPNNVSSSHRIMSASRQNSPNGWAFGVSGAQLLFTTYAQQDTFSTLITITTKSWTHVAVIFSNANALFYVNGVYIQTVSGQAAAANADDVFYIGSATSNGSSTLAQQFDGLIDDVRIYNRVLTAQEVKDLYSPGVILRNAVLRSGKFNQ